MKREQLEHLLRAASSIVGDRDILVVGSQAVLGSIPDERLPSEATTSIEADLAFLDDPVDEKADQVDGAIGELSQFHETHGYYAQGVSVVTAILPSVAPYTPAALDAIVDAGTIATIPRLRHSETKTAKVTSRGFYAPLIDALTADASEDRGRVFAFSAASHGEGASLAVRSVARQLAAFGNVLVLEDGGDAPAEPSMSGDTRIRQIEPNVFAISLESYIPFGTPGDAAERIRSLRSKFRFTLIDGGTVTSARGIRSLAPYIDGTVLVVSAGRLSKRAVAAAARMLESMPAKFAGCLLNRRTYPAPDFVYQKL